MTSRDVTGHSRPHILLPSYTKCWGSRQIGSIPQYTCPISHNTPHWNRNVHVSVPKWCIVDMGSCILGICKIGLFVRAWRALITQVFLFFLSVPLKYFLHSDTVGSFKCIYTFLFLHTLITCWIYFQKHKSLFEFPINDIRPEHVVEILTRGRQCFIHPVE